MKALFIYSKFTGNQKFRKKLDYIKDRLNKRFSYVEIVETFTLDDLKNACHLAATQFDYLIYVGGDGTTNKIVNYLANEPKKPILGYIPGGTSNDFSHNFKLTKNIKKSLDIICDGKPADLDICCVNDSLYFTFTIAAGIFSEIPYVAKRKGKKLLGIFSYYLIAIKDVFKHSRVTGKLECDGKIYDVNTPFFLALNGKHIGGFYLNFNKRMDDGKIRIYLTKPGLFNGLLHYLFFKIRTTIINTSEFSFNYGDKLIPFCVDGERYEFKKIKVKVLPKFYKILVSKKLFKRLYK